MVCSISSKNSTVYYNPNSVIDALFFRHPRQQNETYIEHFKTASKIGFMTFVASFFMGVHALVPGINLFETIGTTSPEYYDNIIQLITRKNKIKTQ